MEQEACSNFKSLRAKFQEEIQGKYRPVLPEKPKRLPGSLGRSGQMNISAGPALEIKTPSLPRITFREDLKTSTAKRPVSFPNTTSEVSATGDGQNRNSLKIRHFPLVLPVSYDPKLDLSSSAPPPQSKGIISPLKCIKKPIPTPFSLTKVSVCPKEMGSSSFNNPAEESTSSEVQQTCVSNSGLTYCSPERSPNESVADSSPGSVSQFFDQHVLSTLEKAKRKLANKNLLACGRPKGFYACKALDLPLGNPKSPARSEAHPETTPVKINGTAHSAVPVMELSGVLNLERLRKPLPDPTSVGPAPLKPPRPPHVDLSKHMTAVHISDAREMHIRECEPEPEILANSIASLEDTSVPPPEFPDFDITAPDVADNSAINLAALELEATEYPESDSLSVQDHGLDVDLQAVLASSFDPSNPPSADFLCQSSEKTGNAGVSGEAVTADLRVNGSHVDHTFSLSTEHQLPSEKTSSHQRRFHESFDNVYEDVETVPKFSFAQSSLKCKAAPKNPYADNGYVKEETWRTIWHVSQCSNAAEDHNGQTQHERKKQPSPEYHDEKELKKKEKQRLEKEKKEQKEKDKKRNEMHKKFKITGSEEPMYHARVLLDGKPRKFDLPVKSGDLVSIIRTVNCPKGKWLARDANNKFGYISVMNVELNIKEMLELGKKVSQAAGRGQSDGDNLSFSGRSFHQNEALTSSFTDDSEEWMYEDDTLSLSADNVSQNRAASVPEMCMSAYSLSQSQIDSTSSALHAFSDWSIEDVHTQETENFQFADIDLLPPPALYADSL